MQRQRFFDRTPTDITAAYKYFRELNRQQKYQTVLRLYNKYEADYRSSMDARSLEKLEAQRAYAQRYVESMQSVERKARGGEGMGSGGSDVVKYAINKFPKFCAQVILMAGMFFMF